MLFILHVDEIDDDDSGEIPQTDLADDLRDRLQVRAQDRLLESALADVLPGVDVDSDKRLGLVDDDRSAGLQPDPRPEGAIELALDAAIPEEGGRAVVHVDAVDEILLNPAHGFNRVAMECGTVHGHPVDIGAKNIAQHALHALAMPPPKESGGPDDGSTLNSQFCEDCGDGTPQLFTLLVTLDPSRYTNMLDAREVDEEATRERHLRRDPCPFLSNRFAGDLDDQVVPDREGVLERSA